MNIPLINQKLEQIDSYSKELESSILSHSPQEVKKESTLLRAAERLVQLIVDTMLDINIHILISKEKSYDKTLSTFFQLGELGALPKDFAQKVAPIVNLRNILVHRYEDLDKELFVRNLFNNASDFKKYIVAIYSFIKKNQE